MNNFAYFIKIKIFCLIICLFVPTSGWSTEEEAREIMKGVLGSFSLPLRDLLEEEETDADWTQLFKGFSGNFAWSYPFKKETLPSGEKKRDIILNASVRYNPLSYWYFTTTFYKHLQRI